MYLQRDMAILCITFCSFLPPYPGSRNCPPKRQNSRYPRSVPHNATANRKCCPRMLSGRACPDGRPRRVACVAVFSSPSCLYFCSRLHAPAGICIFPFRFPFACKIIKTSHSLPPPRLPPNRPPPPVSSSGDARAVPAGLPCISSCHH